MINIFRKIYFLSLRKKRGFKDPYNIYKKFLYKSQYWDREKIENFQIEKMKKIISLAKKESSFYNRILDKFFLVKSLEEFKEKYPHIKKKDIIKNYKDFQTEHFTEKVRCSSSGSTGEPLVLYSSLFNEAFRKALQIRFYDWWGIKPFDKSVLIWRYKEKKGRSKFISNFKKTLLGKYKVDVHDLSESNIRIHIRNMEKFKPKYIRGYKSGVLEFAQLMIRNNISFKKLNLKVVIVTSENLYQQEREIIEKVFNCKVANEYGASELGLLGLECPKGGMHISEEAFYIYTDKKNAVYITDFYNDSMPLINYKNEDYIRISNQKCSCGRSGRIIEEVIGREQGYIIRPDGSKINQFILMVIFFELYTKKTEVVKRFKVHQSNNSFKVKIEPLHNFDDSCKEFIDKRMREEIGKNIQIEFELVKKIERDKSGKLKFFERIDS